MTKIISILLAIAFVSLHAFAQTGSSPLSGGPFTCNPTVQPVDVTTSAGSVATFNTQGNCGSFIFITYQWQVSIDGGHSFSNIPGALSFVTIGPNSYSFTASLSQNGYKYRCRLSTDTSTGLLDAQYTSVVTLGVVNSLVACPGSTFFKTGFTGSAYQWQVYNGTGFTDLMNNGVYAGVNSDSLNLVSPPGNFYGNKYRCAVNIPGGTTYSAIYQLKYGMSWNGAISNEWENPVNWSCSSVPTTFTDIIIPAGLQRYPEVNANTTIRSLKVDSAAGINIGPGIQLQISH